MGWGWFGRWQYLGSTTLTYSFNPSDGLGVVRTAKLEKCVAGTYTFQSLGWVGGGSDVPPCLSVCIELQFQSLGWVGGGSDFVPVAWSQSEKKFQSLGWVGGGSDGDVCGGLRGREMVSIPRMGWGWFGHRGQHL